MTPKLVKELFVRELNNAGRPVYDYRQATIAEVVAWLREQGAGEERRSWWSVASYVIGPVEVGRYLVIPLDGSKA